MLRFRPIAPKPAADGSTPGSKPESNKSTTEPVSKRRAKRKYVRVKKNSKCKSSIIDSEEERKDGSVVTLQLLPESSSSSSRSSRKNQPDSGSFQKEVSFSVMEQPNSCMNFHKHGDKDMFAVDQLDQKVEMQTMLKESEHQIQNHKVNVDTINFFKNPYITNEGQLYPTLTLTRRTLESFVMVEGMSKMFVDREALGSTDMEKIKNLEMDTCPGLISNGLDMVHWVNPAYRRMVDPLEDGGATAEMVVRLVVKEKMNHEELSAAFVCTVRVVYTLRNVRHSRIMPCDVWKMDFGGFAWRLDAKAALSLGR